MTANPTQGAADNALEVTVYEGKYTVIQNASGGLRALRYGKEWRDCVGDGLILALAQEVQELRDRLNAAPPPPVNASAIDAGKAAEDSELREFQAWVAGPSEELRTPEAAWLERASRKPFGYMPTLDEATRFIQSNPDTCAAIILRHSAAPGLRLTGWRDISDEAKNGKDVLLRYERTPDLPEPWPLVIIAHWSTDGPGYWVWQTRATRGYGVQPVQWMPLPADRLAPTGSTQEEK